MFKPFNFERCFRYDPESAQRWTNKPLIAWNVWIGMKQLHDDFSITGPAAFEDGAEEQTSASRIETAPCASVQLDLNSLAVNFHLQFSIFLPAVAGRWGFYIQALWIIQQMLFGIFSLLVINCRVNTRHKPSGQGFPKGQTGRSDCCCKSIFEDNLNIRCLKIAIRYS